MVGPLSKKSLSELLNDPHLSAWFKTALKASLERDPFEACLDAELLYNVLNARSCAIQMHILKAPEEKPDAETNSP